MQTATTEWADLLETISLPALPPTAEALQRLLAHSDDVPVARLAAAIERDPGLTLALLRTINALKHKHLRQTVSTVEHGVMMLGFDALHALPTNVPGIDTVTDPAIRQRLMQLYTRAHHAACQARGWARLRKDMLSEESYAAGLLHGVGEMLLWLAAPEKMQQIDDLRQHKEMEPEEAHYVALGCGIDDITRELANRWRLPPLLRESLLPENAGRSRVLGVMLAVQLARTADRGWYSAEMTELLQELSDYLYQRLDPTVSQVHAAGADAARAMICNRIPHAAALLLHPSRREADPGWSKQHPQVPGVDFCLLPQPRLLDATLQRLEHEAAGAGLKRILDWTLEGMHDGIGLNRVVFAMFNQDRSQLVARHIAGTDNDPHFNRFTIDLEAGNLFTRLLEKPQAVWVNEKNHDRFWPLLPQAFRNHIATDSLFLLSIFVNGRAIGIFYADRHTQACSLDSRSYHNFKRLGLAAARALTAALGHSNAD